MFNKYNSLAFKSGVFAFLVFGLAMTFFILLYVSIAEKNLVEIVKTENDEMLITLIRQFDQNIENYRVSLNKETKSKVFLSTIIYSIENDHDSYVDIKNMINGELQGDFSLLSSTGKIIYSENKEEIKSDFLYFNDIIDNLKNGNSFQFIDDKKNVIFYNTITNNNLLVGYLIYTITFEELFKIIGHLFETTGYNHNISAYFNDILIASSGDNKKGYLPSVHTLKNLPIVFKISTEKNMIMNQIKKSLSSLIFISIITVLILSIIFSIVSSRNMTRPLSILENEINMISQGNLDSLQFRKKDPLEINFLRRSFNSMQHSVQDTNKKLLEINNDLKSTQKQLIQSEKMASIGQLAAGVAHEINNPTGYVTTNIHTMKEYIKVYEEIISESDKLFLYLKNENTDKYIVDIIQKINKIKEDEDFSFISSDIKSLLEESIDGVTRIKDIVNGLRNFARPESTLTIPGDINLAIENSLRLTWNELKYTCEIIKNLSPLPLIECRIDQLTQVFVNLLVNAAHAIKTNGEITISSMIEDNFISVTIEDNGEGIPEENMKKLFDPFFTTKEVGKGTGLGLAISYGIIEEHQGTIDVQSTLGKGTTFNIKLPV